MDRSIDGWMDGWMNGWMDGVHFHMHTITYKFYSTHNSHKEHKLDDLTTYTYTYTYSTCSNPMYKGTQQRHIDAWNRNQPQLWIDMLFTWINTTLVWMSLKSDFLFSTGFRKCTRILPNNDILLLPTPVAQNPCPKWLHYVLSSYNRPILTIARRFLRTPVSIECGLLTIP